MAIKYLAGDRIIGTTAERAAMSVDGDVSVTDETGWTSYPSSGNDIAINSSGVVTGTVGANNGDLISKPHGLTLATTWVLQFAITRTNTGSPNDNICTPILFSSSATGAGDDASDSADSLGIHLHWDNIEALRKDGAASMTHGTSVSISTSTTYYCRLIKTASDAMALSVYTASDFSGSATGTSTLAINFTPQTLTHIKCSAGSSVNPNVGWTVSGIKIYNDTTTASIDYPNLPNGAIFEESDTGKHYMFDGTSAWNEMPTTA